MNKKTLLIIVAVLAALAAITTPAQSQELSAVQKCVAQARTENSYTDADLTRMQPTALVYIDSVPHVLGFGNLETLCTRLEPLFAKIAAKDAEVRAAQALQKAEEELKLQAQRELAESKSSVLQQHWDIGWSLAIILGGANILVLCVYVLIFLNKKKRRKFSSQRGSGYLGRNYAPAFGK